jgi:intracellular multiplication protein IcmL
MTHTLASNASPSNKPPNKNNDEMIDERLATARFKGLKARVQIQTWIISVLALLLVLMLPFAQPINFYYARSTDKTLVEMVGLNMPNMTDRAVLSWATSSIVEIMTMGFGDIDTKIPKERIRFTADGWKAYTKAFIQQKIGESFKQSQLVLTSAPSNTPVIVAQGINPDNVYQWVVQMPVIMTYATNNNVTTKNSGIVTLTIIRVPTEDNVDGIAIDAWNIQ